MGKGPLDISGMAPLVLSYRRAKLPTGHNGGLKSPGEDLDREHDGWLNLIEPKAAQRDFNRYSHVAQCAPDGFIVSSNEIAQALTVTWTRSNAAQNAGTKTAPEGTE